MFFPRKGALSLTLGMGMGGDHVGPTIPPNQQQSQKITIFFIEITKNKTNNKKRICSILFPPRREL